MARTRRRKRGGALQVTDTFAIQRLSGPVSAYYLTPPSSSALPTILLFGELHTTDPTRCDDCSLDAQEPCIKIEDPVFLQAIDAVAETTPIDFFTESSPLLRRYQTQPEKGTLHYDFLKQTVSFCHNASTRAKCPTKHIRWHDADVRYMDQYVEFHGFFQLWNYLDRLLEKDVTDTKITFLSLPEYLKKDQIKNVIRAKQSGLPSTASPHREEVSLQMIPEFLERVLQFPVLDKHRWKNTGYKFILSQVGSYYTWIRRKKTFHTSVTVPSLYHEELYAEARTIIPSEDWERLDTEHVLGHIDQLLHQHAEEYSALTSKQRADRLQALIYVMYQAAIYLYELNVWIWSSLERSSVKSGLLKQLQKQSNPEWRHPTFWIQSMYRSMIATFDILYFCIFTTLESIYRPQPQIVQGLRTAIMEHQTTTLNGPTAISVRMVERIKQIILNLLSHWTDTYTLLRMFKTPEGGMSSALSLGYFGNRHVIHMVQQLLDPFIGYTLEYAHESDASERCVTFSSPVHLGQRVVSSRQKTKKRVANHNNE